MRVFRALAVPVHRGRRRPRDVPLEEAAGPGTGARSVDADPQGASSRRRRTGRGGRSAARSGPPGSSWPF